MSGTPRVSGTAEYLAAKLINAGFFIGAGLATIVEATADKPDIKEMALTGLIAAISFYADYSNDQLERERHSAYKKHLSLSDHLEIFS